MLFSCSYDCNYIYWTMFISLGWFRYGFGALPVAIASTFEDCYIWVFLSLDWFNYIISFNSLIACYSPSSWSTILTYWLSFVGTCRICVFYLFVWIATIYVSKFSMLSKFWLLFIYCSSFLNINSSSFWNIYVGSCSVDSCRFYPVPPSD